MTRGHAVLLIVLGGTGVAKFGGLWIAGRFVHLDWMEAIIGEHRRRRVNRWIRIAPALTVLSLGLVLSGLILHWVEPK